MDEDRKHRLHHYRTTSHWEGSTGIGYEGYERRHTASAAPAVGTLALSSDPAFLGDSHLLNPEQLVVLAASSCQLLSFLAAASRARIDVTAYDDVAEAIMDESDPPVRLRSILLKPTIRVAPGPSEDRIRRLVEIAHRECYIANSLRTDIRIEPTVIFDANPSEK